MALRIDDEQLSLADQVRYLLEMYVEGPHTIAKIFGVFDTVVPRQSHSAGCRPKISLWVGLMLRLLGSVL